MACDAAGSPPAPVPRVRGGALLGAIVGPPVLFLVLNYFLAPRSTELAKTATGGALWVAMMFASWAGAAVGSPLLGATVAMGRWVGRDLARSLANYCIGGWIAGAIAVSLLFAIVPIPKGGGVALAIRLTVGELALLGGVVLCFRERKG